MTRVLIADDDDLMRAGLVELLAGEPGIEIVGTASTGREAVELALRLAADVVLMDVRMPDLDGIGATRELTCMAAHARVVILTTFEQDDYVFGALRAGASGFLLKRTRPEELIAAMHTIAAGDSLLSPSVTRRVVRSHVKRILMKLDLRDRVQVVIFAYESGVNLPAAAAATSTHAAASWPAPGTASGKLRIDPRDRQANGWRTTPRTGLER